jgi:hypothetical protein
MPGRLVIRDNKVISTISVTHFRRSGCGVRCRKQKVKNHVLFRDREKWSPNTGRTYETGPKPRPNQSGGKKRETHNHKYTQRKNNPAQRAGGPYRLK